MMTRIKWISAKGSMLSCGMLRGVVPAAYLNSSRDKWSIDVKTTDDMNHSDFVCQDIVVFQRAFDSNLVDTVRKLRWRGTKVVFDIDDALWLLPDSVQHPEFKNFMLNFPKGARDALFHFMGKEVDVVTASTLELAEAVTKELPTTRVAVVGNYVDPQFFYPIAGRDDKPTFDVAWYAANGHNNQAPFISNVFARLLRTIENSRVHLVGCAKNFEAFKVLEPFGNRVQMVEWVHYTQLGLLLNQFNVVVCPIIDHPFTRCKSEIKALEAGACGCVPVMSKCPQYERYAKNCLTKEEGPRLVLDNDPDLWVETIKALADKSFVVPKLVQRTLHAYSVMHGMSAWGAFYDDLMYARNLQTPSLVV